jgi:hypothetical protein
MPLEISVSVRSLGLLLASAICAGAYAQPSPPVVKAQSHCKPGEQIIMTGRMQLVKRTSKETIFEPNGKYASLCANTIAEPITAMVYRYGKLGQVEMEEIATSDRKFSVFFESNGPNAGSNSIWFSKGDYRYVISAGVGMAGGVSVNVYKGSKQIVDLFSGLNDEDYYSDTLGIEFETPHSPVLISKTPK